MLIEHPENGDLVMAHGYVGVVTATGNGGRVIQVRWLTHWIDKFVGVKAVYSYQNMIENRFSFVRPQNSKQ